MKSEEKPPAKDYAFGHDPEEIRRLETQGRLLALATRDLLGHAGVTTGMHVLDVGCGAGDLAFVAAELVGPTGNVIGFDRADTVLSIAKARAQAMGLTNVRFVQCDIDHAADLATHGPFDAVVSRAIIPYLGNPVESFRKVFPLVRPGGIVSFQEPEASAEPRHYWSTPRLAIFDEMDSIAIKILERGLMRGDALAVVAKMFDEGGITQRRITRTKAIHSASDDDACAWIADMARTLYGLAQRMGFPLPSYDPKTVATELKKELMSKNALFATAQWLGATGRVPGVPSVEK